MITPAFEANLRPDYVITAVNGKNVNTVEDWLRETNGLKAGVPLKLTTAHYGHNEYFSETLTARAIPPEEQKEEKTINRPEIGTNADMILVAGGSFYMGDEGGNKSEKPVHEVEISSFYMSNHEVTQAEWMSIMGTNPSYCVGSHFDEKYQPVERISWKQAIDYCNKRSLSEGLKKCYTITNGDVSCDFSANGYRLPTEAEWEYAARGGSKGKDKKYSGGSNIDSVAWYIGTTGFPRPVMSKAPNKLGLYDLSGNVWEFCWDRYNEDYYAKSPKANPRGAGSSSISSAYVARGGSAYNNAATCTVFNRGYAVKKDVARTVGFRVVRSRID